MAGSMSLPSVVAVYPAISWRGGLPVSCRRICLAPLSSLRVRALCWWNDVRIFRGGFLASGSGQCRATNGVVRALEEAKPGSKSRRRRNRPVKAVEEALEGQEPVHLAPSDGSVVCVDVVDGGESSSEQSSPLSSENPVPKRKSASRGRRKKVSEVKSSPTLSEGQDAQIEVSQQIVDKSRVVSTNGAAEESVSVSQGANATTGSRRRRRSSAKRDGAAVSASSANSKPAQAGQASEAGVDVNGKALEISDREVESPVISVGGSRRKKNVNSNSQEAAPNGSVATSMNEGGSNSISSAESSAKDASLNSSTNVDNELIHGDRIRNSEVRSVTNGSIPAAQPSIEKKETKKRPRSRRKRGQEAQDVKLLGDEELHTIGQVTALSSINGEVERLEGDEKSGKISEEVVNEGHAGGLTPVDSKTKSDAQTDKENGEPKKLKRAKKPRKKPGAVADLDDNTVDKAQVAQSVLLVETTDSETVSSSGSEDDETAGVHVHPIINQDESVLHTPPELKEPFAGADVVCAADVSPPKRRSRRKRQSESNKKVTAQAAIESESEGSDTPSESGEVKDIEGSSRVQFPAPTWGPQWWDEIQAKSQASISFQDIAERKEGIQILTTGLRLLYTLVV